MTLIVNGERVREELLSEELSRIRGYFQSQGEASCCERDDEFRGYANDNVIARVLLEQEAARSTPPPTEGEIADALRNLEEEHGGREKLCEAYGLDPDDPDRIRRETEANLRIRRVLDRECAADGEPREEELRAFHESHLDLYMEPERVRASHVLKGPSRDRRKIHDELRQVREQLLEGADFDELARAHSEKYDPEGKPASDDPAAPRGDGIDLGLFARGELPEEFEIVAFSMREGEVSPVFATPFGFHLLKVTGRRPATPKPFETVREAVLADFLQDRRQNRIARFVEGLRSKATIEQTPDESDVSPA